MNNPWNVIQKLESDNSSLFKQSVIKDNLDNELFIAGARLALDPMVTFGVKQVPFSETDGAGVETGQVHEVFHQLINRQLTGHAARDAIQELCDSATNEQWNDWYRRILIKDLRCGTGAKLINKVQKDTIPLALTGSDVIGQARTGSGKTAAFGLPTMNSCKPTGELQALILTPTRELANQVAEEMNNLQGDYGLKILTVYGGTDLEKQARTLAKGVDIIVGTPGRVMDMTGRGHIDLASPSLFVLDEADRMLDMGFFPDIIWVIERMTSRSQTLLFSATFPQEIIDSANEFMNEPEFILTNTEKLDIPPIEQYSVRIGRANKLWVVGRLLSRMDEVDQTLIFANTKRMVDLLVQRLKKNRFDVDVLDLKMPVNLEVPIELGTKNFVINVLSIFGLRPSPPLLLYNSI